MSTVQNWIQKLAPTHLLNHPFYQAWNKGILPKEALCFYAQQYYHHVKIFPRYLSATHSGCPDLPSRQVLLENLTDEEKGTENHPELWLRFLEAIGGNRAEVENTPLLPETKALIENFFSLARSSYEEGVGVLFSYEHQIPEIAQFKQEILKKHYDITSPHALAFFEVHRQADVYHTEALAQLIEALPPSSQEKAERAALQGARLLWNFLDGIYRQTLEPHAAPHAHLQCAHP